MCVYPVQGPGFDFADPRLPRWMARAHFYALDTQWPTFLAHLQRGCQITRVPFMAPDLPIGFVQRPKQFEALRALLLEGERKDPVAITTALTGAGGFGKTTLAAALCHDEEFIQAFDDGILWTTLGETSDLADALAKHHAASPVKGPPSKSLKTLPPLPGDEPITRQGSSEFWARRGQRPIAWTTSPWASEGLRLSIWSTAQTPLPYNSSEMTYHPPRHLLEVLQKIEYEEALDNGDPRYVDSHQARGSEQTFTRLARKFGWDPASDTFFAPHDKHVLFFGHIGSGKTTELRRYAATLNDSKHFYVVEVDVLAKLDRNNLQYTEVLMAMAETLLERLTADHYPLNEAALKPIRDWFVSVVKTRTTNSEQTAEVKTSAEASGGIPALIKLLAGFTAAFKTGSSHKSEWRQEIRNGFTALANAFNDLIRRAEAELVKAGRAERLLFLIDGTDKMGGEDTQQFFVQDAEQLLAIQTLVIYTAPIQMKYDGRLGGKLEADIVLPMIKLEERDRSPFEIGRETMRKLLLLRADRSLFASDADVDRLVKFSGGHPRELLRLLKLCCELADEYIDGQVVQSAIDKLAGDYRYFLKPADYTLLKAIDTNPAHDGNDERAQDLLHRLALLQYNDGKWRRSHPVVRTLEGYKFAITPTSDPLANVAAIEAD